MPVTATCPSCSQLCQVEDQFAGTMVRCPKCGTIIQMPAAAAPVAAAPLPATPIVTSAPAAAPPGGTGPGFVQTVQQSATSFGLDALGLKLLYAGVACLAGMVLFTFLPWLSIPSAIMVGPVVHGSILGISIGSGILNFLLSAAAIAFLIVVLVVVKKKETFDISLWVVGGWSVLAALWRLIQVIHYGQLTGLGLIIVLLASMGASGTFGFIIFQRFLKNKLKA
jgi:hypothetical protein